MEKFDQEHNDFMNKCERRMWFGVGAATLIIFLLLLWGIAHKPLKLKKFPVEKVQS